MTQDERYERAKRRVIEVRKLYGNVATYLVVMIVLFLVDASDRGNWWVYWPALGWGAAIVLHALRTLGSGPGSRWEKRKIREYMEKDGSDSP